MMTYEESAELMSDATFRGRVKVACLKFASFIFGEAPGVEAHNSRYKWAQQTFLQPDITAAQIQQPTVMDAAVQDAGVQDGKALITDAALQTSVETVVNKVI